jgi:sortase A
LGPVRRVVSGVGRTLIALGVLILLFVAYELWGTSLAEARSQRALRHQFLRSSPVSQPARPATSSPGATTTVDPATVAPPLPDGDAIARLKIPRIKLDKIVVEGVALDDLKRGPGHYPGTPLPGQPGNAAIAGHRTTYGAPFFDLDSLKPDDEILVTTRQGSFEYRVRASAVVAPNEVQVLNAFPDNRLTLTTCNPRFSASQRLVVVSQLVGPAAASSGSPSPAPSPTAPAPVPRSRPKAGLSGAGAARWPALGWGLAAAAVWLAAWALGRSWRRWPAYALGTPVFLVVLFFFFENFSRMLPANY